MKFGLMLNRRKRALLKPVCDFKYNRTFYSQVGVVTSAIDSSYLVLMCYSEKYKESAKCRLEGEYTMTVGVDFIPLRMQQKYMANGW